jgi:hypothetical protein
MRGDNQREWEPGQVPVILSEALTLKASSWEPPFKKTTEV